MSPHYERATIIFYTGTGNSYRVATWLGEAAGNAGAAATVTSTGSARPAEEIGEGEQALLGLVFPTHGFTAPWAMLRFAFRLPRRRGTHAVVLATRAGMKLGPVFTPGVEGSATFLVSLILALKGYRVRGTLGVDMPSNWIALHPGLSSKAAAAITDRARDRVAPFANGILAGGRRYRGWVPLLIGLVFWPLSLAYLLVGRLFLARLFFASDRCTGCGLCARHCPNSAIRMLGREGHRRPYWTFRCESCMRCMAFCPTQAVEANYLLAVGVYLLAAAVPTAAVLGWLTARLPALGFLDHTPRLALETLYAIAGLGVIYPLLHLLLAVRPVKRFFTLTTPTHYYRRYRAPGTTLRDLE